MKRMSEVLAVSPTGYYEWRRRQPSARAQRNAALLERIRAVHTHSRGTYGSPRVHAELRAQGVVCNRKRVARLMRQHGICSCRGQRRRRTLTTQSQHGQPVAPNHLARDFTAEGPNRKWLADITYIPTRQGWLYLAVVLDLFSRQVVGWAMDTSLHAPLAERALDMALARRHVLPGQLLHHSDRGVQYVSTTYQAMLKACAALVSMSRVANCLDNAPPESFFGTLKSELIHRHDYLTRDHARADIFWFIECFYNSVRRHSSLGYLSPVDFERLHAAD